MIQIFFIPDFIFSRLYDGNHQYIEDQFEIQIEQAEPAIVAPMPNSSMTTNNYNTTITKSDYKSALLITRYILLKTAFTLLQQEESTSVTNNDILMKNKRRNLKEILKI